MFKAAKMLLGTALILAVTGGSQVRAGSLGFEWGINPVIPFTSEFDMKFDNAFTVSWKVSDSFTVGVFRSAGNYAASHSYVNDTGATAVTQNLGVAGTTATSGIRFLSAIPTMSFLTAGLEIGTMMFGAPTYSFINSDGAVPDGTAFGLLAVPTNALGTAAMLGLTAKAQVLRAESSTVTTDISIGVSFHIVDVTDTNLLGAFDSNTVVAAAGNPKAIDSIDNYNNLTISIATSIWF